MNCRTLQKPIGVRKFGALRRSDIDMSRKRIYVAKCHVANACRWMIVMQQLAKSSTRTHHLKHDGRRLHSPDRASNHASTAGSRLTTFGKLKEFFL